MELYPIEEAQAPTAEWHREERLHGRGGGTLHCRRDRGRDEFGSKIFFAPVFMRVRRPKFGSQPRMDVGLNACQVRRKHASAPRQLTLSHPDFENSRNPVSTMKRVSGALCSK
jgi:hypothetical protein